VGAHTCSSKLDAGAPVSGGSCLVAAVACNADGLAYAGCCVDDEVDCVALLVASPESRRLIRGFGERGGVG
jgi:hypothetical protein